MLYSSGIGLYATRTFTQQGNKRVDADATLHFLADKLTSVTGFVFACRIARTAKWNKYLDYQSL